MYDISTAKTCLNISAALIALALSGCSSGWNAKDVPRSLSTAPLQPTCVMFCFGEVVITDTEEDIASSGGGDVTATNEITETVSGPSIASGASESESKAIDTDKGAPE